MSVLVDDGQEEVRVDGAIFEPLYYQIDVEKPSSPSEAFPFCKIHSSPGRSSEMGAYLPA